jgi:hypothetical protein
MPNKRIGETLDVILRAVRQMIKPELVLDPHSAEGLTEKRIGSQGKKKQ